MKVSVIVPVYNVSNYIIKCINSLVNQTLKDIEIIIVNDGSTDDSIKKVIDNFDDSRIVIVYKKNGGLASARNTGVRYAKGEYLFFVDSDDFIDPNTLKEMYEEANNKNLDIVYCDCYIYYQDNKKEYLPSIKFYDENNLKNLVTGIPGAVCKLIKRDLYLKYDIKFLEGYFFEDLAIMPFFSAIAKKASYLRKPFYYYFQREGSILNKTSYDTKWEDIFFVLEYLKKKFLDTNLFDEYKDELEYLYIEHLLRGVNFKFLDYEEGNKNIIRVAKIMKQEFPKWKYNKYYKKENIKYKIYCNLFYYKQIKLLKIMRKLRSSNNG